MSVSITPLKYHWIGMSKDKHKTWEIYGLALSDIFLEFSHLFQKEIDTEKSTTELLKEMFKTDNEAYYQKIEIYSQVMHSHNYML